MHHDVVSTLWDELRHGWRMECMCGFTTDPSKKLSFAGEDFDRHLIDEGVTMKGV